MLLMLQVCLMNYKKGGFPFWNQFFLAPIHDNSGVVEYYLGIQSDVTEQVESARLAQTHLEGEISCENHHSQQCAWWSWGSSKALPVMY